MLVKDACVVNVFDHQHRFINSEYRSKLMNDRKGPRKVAVEISDNDHWVKIILKIADD